MLRFFICFWYLGPQSKAVLHQTYSSFYLPIINRAPTFILKIKITPAVEEHFPTGRILISVEREGS